MPEQEQDILTQSLLKLEEELGAFGAVHHKLKEAHDQLSQAEIEWQRLTKEQQQTALELVGATKHAIAATHAVTAQAETLAGALLPLAKAIENVNFPMRLDKVDMAVSTQALAISSLQATSERGFAGINDRLGRADERLSALMTAAKTRHRVVVGLVILNLIIVAGGVVLYAVQRW
jgi:hypothetical protein